MDVRNKYRHEEYDDITASVAKAMLVLGDNV